jgi:hypothetical protein
MGTTPDPFAWLHEHRLRQRDARTIARAIRGGWLDAAQRAALRAQLAARGAEPGLNPREAERVARLLSLLDDPGGNAGGTPA